MYKFSTTKRFDKALKVCQKRGYSIAQLKNDIELLVENESLPPQYKTHTLHGNHNGAWEAHKEYDLPLICEQNDEELTLLMLTTGPNSH